MRLRWRGLMALMAVLAVVMVASGPLRADTLRIVGTHKLDDTPQTQLLVKIYGEAFRRAGHELKYVMMPAKRASRVAEDGHVDGELTRVESYGLHHDTLVRVAEPPFAEYFVAYVRDGEERQFASWDDFWWAPYKISYRRGVVRVRAMLRDGVPAGNLVAEKSILDGLRKLAAGRVDVFIETSAYVNGVLLRHPDLQPHIKEAGRLETYYTYMYLHEKHAQLAPEIAKALKDMKAEGVIKAYANEVYTAAEKTSLFRMHW